MTHCCLEYGSGAIDTEVVPAIDAQSDQLIAIRYDDFALRTLFGVVELFNAATKTHDQIAGVEGLATGIALVVRDWLYLH